MTEDMMGDITFGPGETPVIRDGLQERFWALLSVEAGASAAMRRAEATGSDVDQATAIRDRARAELEAFLHEHPAREFAVFRPEDIARAFVPGPTLFPTGDTPADDPPAENEQERKGASQ